MNISPAPTMQHWFKDSIHTYVFELRRFPSTIERKIYDVAIHLIDLGQPHYEERVNMHWIYGPDEASLEMEDWLRERCQGTRRVHLTFESTKELLDYVDNVRYVWGLEVFSELPDIKHVARAARMKKIEELETRLRKLKEEE